MRPRMSGVGGSQALHERFSILPYLDSKGSISSSVDTERTCVSKNLQRISYVTRKTNEEILQQTGQKRELLKNVMNRQLQFFGHVMRK